MKRRDDAVFFFTFVDLLLVTIFLGLVLFVNAEAEAKAERATKRKLDVLTDSLTRLAGVSDLVELTDRLSRLAPVRDIEATMQVVRSVGGRDSVATGMQRLRKLEGQDLPPCLVDERDGKRVVTPIAELTATDTALVFTGRTAAFDSLLAKLGTDYESVRMLPVPRFRAVFEGVLDLRPECRYTVILNERTQLVAPRDAVGRAFYHRIRRR